MLQPLDSWTVVPIGLLARLGVAIAWQRDDVHLRKIPVSMKQNCPCVDNEWGETLIKEVENDMGKQLCALHLGLPDDEVMITRQELEKWLPETPAHQIIKLVVPKAVDAEQLPFRRHFRKRIHKAKISSAASTRHGGPKGCHRELRSSTSISGRGKTC